MRPAKYRRAEARRIVNEINEKLIRGWNPFTENPANEQFGRLMVAVNKAVDYKLKLAADNNKSSFKSKFSFFEKWLKDTGNENILCSQFTNSHALDFMEHVMVEKEISTRTFNNYLTDIRTVFNYLVSRGYFTKNPFLAVKKMRVSEVRKEAFTLKQQRAFSAYVRENDYDMYIISALVYHCAIRESEIARLRVSDVLETGFIRITGKVNKTDRVRMALVPEPFNDELLTYVSGLPGDWFLIGEGLKPAPKTANRMVHKMGDRFRKYRKLLDLPKTVTLYALKDTAGDRLIENGFNAKQIRDQMGHKDLSITDHYIKTRKGFVDEKILKEFPRF